MVRRFRSLALILVLIPILQSCGFTKKVWNAEAPARVVARTESTSLPEFTQVFSRNEKTSDETLLAWRNHILSSFRMIEGARKDYLSRSEIRTLAEAGLIRLDDNPKLSGDRAMSIIELLGFKNGIAYTDVVSLLDWLKAQKREARSFYEILIDPSPLASKLDAEGLLNLASFSGSFLELLGDEPVARGHLAGLIRPFVPTKMKHLNQGLESGVDLVAAFFGTLCGDRVDPAFWNGKKAGRCIQDLASSLRESGPAIDFMLGHRSPFERPEEIRHAARMLIDAPKNWISGHEHPLFRVSRIMRFSEDLEIPPPKDFLRLTEWMPLLNAESTREALSVTLLTDLAGVAGEWVIATLDALARESCDQRENWRTCPFQGVHEVPDRLFRTDYGNLVRSKNLGFVDRSLLFFSLSGFVLRKLDPEHREISGKKIENLITLSIRLLDTSSFGKNVIARILEKPLEGSMIGDQLETHPKPGIAELAFLTADLLPARAEFQVPNRNRNLPRTIDRIGLASLLSTYDLIQALNEDALQRYRYQVRAEGPFRWIKRRKVMESLPAFLHDHFPRIYSECLRLGFERTCGVFFNELLPNALPGKDELETYEMDVLSVSAIFLEGIMGRCDRNRDGKIGSNAAGTGIGDEKNCVLVIASLVAERLMDAGFVERDSNTEFLIRITRNFFAAKWVAKAALTRGTLRGLGWFLGPATLGSTISITAEIMDLKKVKAIEAGTDGPQDSVGDELLYRQRLTRDFLPVIEP